MFFSSVDPTTPHINKFEVLAHSKTPNEYEQGEKRMENLVDMPTLEDALIQS